ncbi:hypothetical protein SAMN04488040_0129 [Sulfitobacter marinus]|uniref:Uncharacterized protein n=1 Tax=Sulfitobacter marinus TaxID=394264 RepID=A0A1I6PEU8_9RHOB|nr:hypothetical protein SAMN04488040_0129 [Sulfitobacter marinus]
MCRPQTLVARYRCIVIILLSLLDNSLTYVSARSLKQVQCGKYAQVPARRFEITATCDRGAIYPDQR